LVLGSFKLALENRSGAGGQNNEAERLRLALIGAQAVAFDWTIADDHIRWDGAKSLRGHPGFERLTSGHAFRAWLGPEARGRLLAFIEELFPVDPAFSMEFEAFIKSARRWFEISALRVSGPEGRAERVTGVIREISDRKTALAQLSYLATRDELTGYLNRTRLREELSQVIRSAAAEGRCCAYLVAAIDKLAVINETYGFDVADEVIVATGKRLSQTLRGSDAVGRTAGNKFGIILSECGEDEIPTVVERMHAALQGLPIETRAGNVSVSVSVGAVCSPRGAGTSQEAMLRAEEALERAKQMGCNGFALYSASPRRDSERRRRLSIGEDVASALNEQRLIFAYQPIVSASSRRPEHYECLLRLVRKDGTIAPASEFIPVAETLGLVRLLDRRALEMAVSQLYRHKDIRLSINVSGTTASDRSWLLSFITYVHENRDVADRMTVELTETAALQSFEENARFITRLRDMGCRVAIDDFGAGYTSFRNLHNLRVDMVKIDGAYVTNLSKSPDNQLFVRTLADLAKNLRLETVAEWVGSEEDAKLLAEFGIDYFQGNYFGEPQISPAWNTPVAAE
jgi:diguanylate cyclase (GGDEF)-like protein